MRFEYLLIKKLSEDIDFNKLGRDGWELVCVVYSTSIIHYFKRQIN